MKRGAVNATGLRTAIWRCDLVAELPLVADGSPRPKPVDHRIEKQPFAPPSMMGYCSRTLVACYTDNNWQIQFLYGSAKALLGARAEWFNYDYD